MDEDDCCSLLHFLYVNVQKDCRKGAFEAVVYART